MPPAVHSSPGGQLPRQTGKIPPHASNVELDVDVVVEVDVVGAGAVDEDVVVVGTAGRHMQNAPIAEPAHSSPSGQLPRHAGATPPQVANVVVVVMVVDVVVLVVDEPAQSPQQLPAPSVPPRASQRLANRVARHRSPPFRAGTRQVTPFAIPQVERRAHWITLRLQAAGRRPPATSARVARVMHAT